MGVRIETGDLISPDGTPYRGFKVTIGGIQDPSQIKRTYDDIEAIFKSHEVNFKTHEERDVEGHFKSYSVET